MEDSFYMIFAKNKIIRSGYCIFWHVSCQKVSKNGGGVAIFTAIGFDIEWLSIFDSSLGLFQNTGAIHCQAAAIFG